MAFDSFYHFSCENQFADKWGENAIQLVDVPWCHTKFSEENRLKKSIGTQWEEFLYRVAYLGDMWAVLFVSHVFS